MKITRGQRLSNRQSDAAETKRVNRVRKDKERIRRDARMIETIKAGDLPYAHTVMCWLSRKLGKRSNLVTPEDVKTVGS